MIELHEIVKRYEEHEILKGVSLKVSKGEVCALLGPSGSGKSTLLRTINGLEDFESGHIRVSDIYLGPRNDPKRYHALQGIRKRIGMVFQQFHLFPHRTVLENVIEGPVHVLGVRRDEAIERAKSLLDRVGMLAKANARPATLSGGQQQRVAIARSLAMQPEAMLFDEPTSALDPEMTGEVTAVMADLAREGQTMIVVTHDAHFARATAHRAVILSQGNIVEAGEAKQVLFDPQHEATKRLLDRNRS